MTKALLSYVPVCDAIAQLLWPHAEVVLHDLKTGTIAYIANSYSKRRAGDSSLNETESALDLADDVIGPYPKTNWDGRRLKSITSVLRDARGKPIGLLCINHDIEALAGALELLNGLITLPAKPERSDALFSKDWREAINTIVGRFLKQRKTTIAGLTSADTDALIAVLDKAGMFEIRKAVPYIAEVLKLSRATIYNRLGSTRERAAAKTS
jgi:predicted transcriptional regulator YheO